MEEQETQLSKQERRELAKEQRAQERGSTETRGQFTKWFVWLVIIGLVGGGGWWVWKELTRPAPAVLGEAMEDMGRDHVSDGTVVDYNSNPPTSGSHYGDWTKAGVYGKPVSDGHLVHSLEHGYVILSYNCTKEISSFQFPISNVLAHEEGLAPSATESATPSAELGSQWNSQECKDLAAKLTSVYEKKGKKKLIVIPRPNLDTKIALTAWNHIDKFDDLDEQRIENFIDAFRNKGPEKTVE